MLGWHFHEDGDDDDDDNDDVDDDDHCPLIISSTVLLRQINETLIFQGITEKIT